MSRKTLNFGMVCGAAALAVFSAACSADVQGQAAAAADQQSTGVVAQGTTRDGAELTITYLGEGTFSITRLSSTMSLPRLVRGSSLAELFETETESAAPETLVRAVAAAHAAKAATTAEEQADTSVAPEEATIQEEPTAYGLSAAQFQSLYCGAGVNTCLTSRTGNGRVATNKTVFAAVVVAHPYRGNLVIKAQQYRFGDWQTLQTFSVLEGQTLDHIIDKDAVLSKQLGAQITNAEGDGYHISLEW
jgi:hypothetical protein